MISVIVPIFKVEPYLPACVDSILAQSYSDFELILVDDGSPDACGRLCDEYAAKDPRIRVIHKPNGGLSDARNAGLDIARGAYITFIDSDDMVHEDFLAVLLAALVSHDAQISVCKPLEFSDGAAPQWPAAGEGRVEVMDSCRALESIFIPQPEWLTESSCAKLYQKEVIGAHRFPVGRQHEDTFTTYRYLFKARNVVFIDRKMYGYRTRAGSIVNQPFRLQRLDAVDATREMIEFTRQHCPQLLMQASAFHVRVSRIVLHELISAHHHDPAIPRELRRAIFMPGRPLRNPVLSRREKLWLLLLACGVAPYAAVYRRRVRALRTRALKTDDR